MNNRNRAATADLTITPDMMRRRLADRVPFGLKDVCGLIAGCLCGTGLCGWFALAASLSVGG